MLRINIENGDAHFSSRFILDPWHIHTHILKLLSILFTAQQHTALLHYHQRALHLLSTCVEKLLSCTTVFAALPGPRFRFARFETVRHSAPSESKPAGEDFPTAPKTRAARCYIYKTCSVLRRTTGRYKQFNDAHDRLAALPRSTPSRGHVVGAKTTTKTAEDRSAPKGCL